MWFVRFSYYKTANYTAPCVIVRCGCAILQVILMRFLLFMQFVRFGKHPYFMVLLKLLWSSKRDIRDFSLACGMFVFFFSVVSS